MNHETPNLAICYSLQTSGANQISCQQVAEIAIMQNWTGQMTCPYNADLTAKDET